ncbi:MAG: urease accessory protein UreD [Lachnospiraceae bacterium]
MLTELRLEIEQKNNRSVVSDRYFTAPLKLGIPKLSGDRLEVFCMLASAGLLEGDEHLYTIQCKENTKSRFTDQSYTKLFRMNEGEATKSQQIFLEKNASFFYCPHAVIPFQNSAYTGKMRVTLEESSEFFYTDIFAVGRVGMGETFAFRSYRNRVEVMLKNRPVWIDNTCFFPEKMKLDQSVFFDHATHMGTLYYYGPKEKQIRIQKEMEEEIQQQTFFTNVPPKKGKQFPAVFASVTEAVEGICIRALSRTAQEIELLFEKIEKLVSK